MKNSFFIHNKLWKTFLTLTVMGNLGLVCPASWALEEKANLQAAPAESSAPNPSGDKLADQAGDDFTGGAKSLGSGFKKGAKVTGGAFKKAGVTMGKAFKKAGKSIKEFFVGKKDSEVEEKDLAQAGEDPTPAAPSMEEIRYNQDLDRVGDEPVEGPQQAKSGGNPKS